MSKINAIQNAIKELEGGEFQKLFDAYLFKKFKFNNIQTLGVQEGTNKTTKGTPDSYVINSDNTYTLIMYGTVEARAFGKLKSDILSCFDKDKVKIEEEKISKVICAFSSTNISVEQMEILKNLITGKEIELIGLSTISHDLLVNYPFLAAEFLNVPVDTQQIYSRDEFVQAYDKNGMNAPLEVKLIARKEEQDEIYGLVEKSFLTLITGASGVGKTRLILEVCQKYEERGWKIYCVKNNGELLAKDIKYYFSESGKYIFFIDDANQTTSLEYILSYMTNLPQNVTVKIIMSVRDYAKGRVKRIVCSYCQPVEIKISTLKKDEIKEILKINLNILNDDYLDRIAEISKGNPRLAILAGKIAKENGYLAIRNATDIFQQYYGRILNNSELSKDLINALFVIALLGPIKFKQSIISQQLLEIFEINMECFSDLCHELSDRELIDLYQDEVVKINDQSLGNYMLQHVLIETKTISIEHLLKIGFPKFKNKIVYALNTLINLFYSDDTKAYIEEQVNEAWNTAAENIQWDYLECFHALNEEKSLLVINSEIRLTEKIELNLEEYDFEKKKNYNSINSNIISVLCGFKYSDYYEDAIDLLILYYKKRPDLFVEFYFAFTDRLSFDRNSYALNYEKEYILVKKLWANSKEATDKEVVLLMLRVLEVLLDCNFHKTESGENNRTFCMINFNVPLVEGSKKIRLFMWSILSTIYEKGLYKELIHSILSKNHISGLDKEEARMIFEYDWKHIKELFFKKWNDLSFEQCKVLKELEKDSEWLAIEHDSYFDRFKENKEFFIYNSLLKNHEKGRSWEEDRKEREIRILELTEKYTLNEYEKLFSVCKKLEHQNENEAWDIREGLRIVFESVKDNDGELYNLVEKYLQCGSPYGQSMGWLIEILIEQYGKEEAKNLIDKHEFPYKSDWLCEYYAVLPEKIIDQSVMGMFREYINSQALLDEPKIPMFEHLRKYKKVDVSIVKDISELVLRKSEVKPYLVTNFLGHFLRDEALELMEEVFDENWCLLGDLYILAIGHHFDYEGKLLIKIIEKDDAFWDKFTKKLAGNVDRTSYELNVFERIWARPDYKEKIQVAFKNMIGDHFSCFVEDEAMMIFGKRKETSEEVVIRKKEWIKEYILREISNQKNIVLIFGIIATVLPGYRNEFVQLLVSCSDDIEMFQTIPLFSYSASWSGSEVPLIDKKIDFLSELIVSLKGVKFIEHRAYLKEKKENYEKYKQDVLIREYIENVDLA